MVKKNSLNTIIWLSVLLLGIIAGVFLVQKNQNISEKAAPASTLSLVPETQELSLGSTFVEHITVNTGVNKITGIDIRISYDSSKININEIKPTSELASFTTVIKNEIDNSVGKLRYTAFSFDRNLSISGNLNILTLSGIVPSNSTFGTYEIKFDPETIIIAVDEGENVLINTTGVMVKVVEGQPNSCGGTCGSNNNCQANYFCYQGYCRNPVCQSDTDCNCTQTAAPTARPVTTTRPTVRPVTIVITPTPSPTPTALNKGGIETLPPITDYSPTYPDIEREPDTSLTTEDLKNQALPTYLKWGGIILILIVIAGLLTWKRQMNIPRILPPTNI